MITSDKVITLEDILSLVDKSAYHTVVISDEDGECICYIYNEPEELKTSLSQTEEEVNEALAPYLDRRVRDIWGSYEGIHIVLYGKKVPDGEH